MPKKEFAPRHRRPTATGPGIPSARRRRPQPIVGVRLTDAVAKTKMFYPVRRFLIIAVAIVGHAKFDVQQLGTLHWRDVELTLARAGRMRGRTWRPWNRGLKRQGD